MRFFPALTEEFTSPLPPAELLRHVQASVQQAREFSGRVAGSQFTISRVIDYRNSLPQLDAAPHQRRGSCRANGGQPLAPAAPAAPVRAGIWGHVARHRGQCGRRNGLTLVQGAFRTVGEGSVWPSLILVGMLAVGLLLFTVPFWAEVRQSRPRLIELLRLAPTAPQGTPPGADQR
jgi:hypothetical protein